MYYPEVGDHVIINCMGPKHQFYRCGGGVPAGTKAIIRDVSAKPGLEWRAWITVNNKPLAVGVTLDCIIYKKITDYV